MKRVTIDILKVITYSFAAEFISFLIIGVSNAKLLLFAWAIIFLCALIINIVRYLASVNNLIYISLSMINFILYLDMKYICYESLLQ